MARVSERVRWQRTGILWTALPPNAWCAGRSHATQASRIPPSAHSTPQHADGRGADRTPSLEPMRCHDRLPVVGGAGSTDTVNGIADAGRERRAVLPGPTHRPQPRAWRVRRRSSDASVSQGPSILARPVRERCRSGGLRSKWRRSPGRRPADLSPSPARGRCPATHTRSASPSPAQSAPAGAGDGRR